MTAKYLCFVLIGWLFHSTSYALELQNLPFFNAKTDFVIELSDNKKLLPLLEEELTRQRKNNRQLQQYSKPNKIARFESQLLNERLRAEGYYAAEIRSIILEDRLVYRIDSGPLYHIEQVSLDLPSVLQPPAYSNIGIQTGDPLRAKTVLAAKKALSDYVEKNFCLYQVDVDYHVRVLHESRLAKVTLSVKDSQSVTIGNIIVTGLQTLDERYFRDRLLIKEGDCFKRSQIDATHLNLMQSNLIARADFKISEPSDNRVAITIAATERFHRTLSAGGGYQSDEGFGISAGWEHRNLLGRAQTLSLDAYLAENLQTASSSLTLRHFRRSNQSITFYSELEHGDTDAFETKLATVGVELSRMLNPQFRATLGTEIEFSEVGEDNETENFALLSIPLSLEYDKRDDPLDPLSGWVASGQIRPYWDMYDTNTLFVKTTLAASFYISFEDYRWRPTFSVRGAVGTINGIERKRVPANIRYYAGGSGSVRGYPYQSLGPLTDNDPDGGLSFADIALETRLRWGENWGGVVFLDGGYAYEDASPKFDQDLRWGAGFGIRYYTSLAPIRFDFAVPLNKRDAIDDDFQLYISIGQAF